LAEIGEKSEVICATESMVA